MKYKRAVDVMVGDILELATETLRRDEEKIFPSRLKAIEQLIACLQSIVKADYDKDHWDFTTDTIEQTIIELERAFKLVDGLKMENRHLIYMNRRLIEEISQTAAFDKFAKEVHIEKDGIYSCVKSTGCIDARECTRADCCLLAKGWKP